MTTRFRPDGDDIIVNGAKTFITNGDVADLILLFGKWSEIDDPKRAISVLIARERHGGIQRSSGSRTRWVIAAPRPRRSRSPIAACRARI